MRWLVTLILVCVTATLTGLLSAAFLKSLELVTALREQTPWLMLFLPLAGFCSAWLYERYGQGVESGSLRLFAEIQNPKSQIPLRMGPLVWAGSLLSHLFGASAGREGTAVQLGGCLADQVHARAKQDKRTRSMVLMAGVAAGFGSVFGVPWAGFVFALEAVSLPRRARLEAMAFCLVAAHLANWVTLAVGIHHTPYPQIGGIHLQPRLWLGLALLGVGCGVMAWLFSRALQLTLQVSQKRITYGPYRTMVGGAVISLGLLAAGNQYAGLGVDSIVQAFSESSTVFAPFLKLIFTALTLGTGFKGGEVTPLLFVGATLGSWWSTWGLVPLALATGVGLVSVLAGVLQVPIACSVMAGELMGWKVGLCALPVCYLSALFYYQFRQK